MGGAETSSYDADSLVVVIARRLVEPFLSLIATDTAVDRFADAIVRALDEATRSERSGVVGRTGSGEGDRM